MVRTTFWDIIKRTFKEVKTPLSPKEIWDKANELGLIGDFETTGKTPWATIAAYCYTEINKNGDNSIIIQSSDRPAQFFLREMINKIDFHKAQKQKENEDIKKEEIITKKYDEKALHPILVAYASSDTHFKANLKTISHQVSTKSKKGTNEWLHPDLVGVYFPFQDYRPETLEIQNHLSITSIKLFSFEMKISLTFSSLRESYFQAVSNSSWANEGYLVALKIDEDPSFKDEMRRLNNAFGIGIIKLNPENIFESEILFPSRINTEIDWDTVNRLASQNPDFTKFLNLISEDCKLGRIKSQYDAVLSVDELDKYIFEKGIKDAL